MGDAFSSTRRLPAPRDVTAGDFSDRRDRTAAEPDVRASLANLYFQYVSVLALIPSSAANSLAVRSLSSHRRTRFDQTSRDSRGLMGASFSEAHRVTLARQCQGRGSLNGYQYAYAQPKATARRNS